MFHAKIQKGKSCKKILKLETCIEYLDITYRILKGITGKCTNVRGNISRFWSVDKKLCLKCVLYLQKENAALFGLFISNEVIHSNLFFNHNDIIREYIIELHEHMLKVWRGCARRCHETRYILPEVKFPSARFYHYDNKLHFYTSSHFDAIRNQHHNLAIFMQEALQATALDKDCGCVEKYMKVSIAILIDGHVDNVSGFFNPRKPFVIQMWKFYKIAQRLYNEKIKFDHEEINCYDCRGFLQSQCHGFTHVIQNTPDRGDTFRLDHMQEYLIEIWGNCPVRCIDNYREPSPGVEGYSVTLGQVYHLEWIFED